MPDARVSLALDCESGKIIKLVATFKDGSPTHFVDRDPDSFSKVLNYLRNGTLHVDKNCNLGGTVLRLSSYVIAPVLTSCERFY